MARKEEIINAAHNEAEVERQLKMHPQVFEQGFVAVAKWADAHPDINVRTMAAWQSGYNEAVDKACEWLEKTFKDGELIAPLLLVQLKDKFRKAMGSGCSGKPNNCEKGGEE